MCSVEINVGQPEGTSFVMQWNLFKCFKFYEKCLDTSSWQSLLSKNVTEMKGLPDHLSVLILIFSETACTYNPRRMLSEKLIAGC